MKAPRHLIGLGFGTRERKSGEEKTGERRSRRFMVFSGRVK